MALILIADSSAPERQRLRQIVEAQDHVVVEADSNAYCLEIAEYHHPQVVLLNLEIEAKPAFDLLAELQELAIATIAFSSDPQPDWTQRCLGLGAIDLLRSPPPSSSLLEALNGSSEYDTSAPAISDSAPSAPPSEPPSDPSSTQTRPSDSSPSSSDVQQLLSIDKLQYLIGLGSNKAADTLTELTACDIHFEPPAVETMTARSLQQLLYGWFGSEPVCSAQLPFSGGLNGTAQLFFPQASAISLTSTLTGESPTDEDFDQLKEEALTEVGNIVLNSVMGAMSNALSDSLTFAVPIYQEEAIADLTQSLAEDETATVLLAQTHFQIESLQISGDIILFFKMQLFFDLATNHLKALDSLNA